MNPLVAVDFPLTGPAIVEASAGTGKTYNIVRIYLRQVMERNIRVRSLATATFTNAAADELQGRIRTGLKVAWWLATDKPLAELSEDEREEAKSIRPLLEATARTVNPDDPKAGLKELGRRLRLALLELDGAAIGTIDALCLRWIREYALDAGTALGDFEATDGKQIRSQAIDREFARLSQSTGHGPAWVIGLLGVPDHRGERDFNRWIERLLGQGSDRLQQDWQQQREVMALPTAWNPATRDAFVDQIVENDGKPYSAAKDGPRTRFFGNAHQAAIHAALPERVLACDETIDLAALRTIATSADKKWLLKAGQKNPDIVAHWEAMRAAFETAWRHVHAEVLAVLVNQCLPRIEAAMAFSESSQNLRTYGEITRSLRDALVANPRLGAAIRRDYPVALVDEFQDSSPAQSEIFFSIYGPWSADTADMEGDPASLVLIGDPKQSIYRFRGGDVFAYLSARERIPRERHFSITENYRSTQPFMDMVNTLFDDDHNPFAAEDEDGIHYAPNDAGAGWQDRRQRWPMQDADGEAALTPGRAWLFDAPGNAEFAPGAETVAAPANEIVEDLMGKQSSAAVPEPIRPGDIAILTRTNSSAAGIYRRLARLGYPVAMRTRSGVFASTEATDLLRVLDACAHPGDEYRLKAALTTPIMGLGHDDLVALFGDDSRWEGQLTAFQRYRELWRESGVLALIYALCARQAPLLLAGPEGTRTLTNWLQLAELCQEAANRHGNPLRLLQWLRQSITAAADGEAGDREQLRLETDADAIQIVTLHRSKGLQYPLVVLVDPWRAPYRARPESMAQPGYGPFEFHDPDTGEPRLELLSANRTVNARQRFLEELQEDIRLAYVGITRAQYHCSFLWGREFKAGIWLSGFQWLVCDQSSRSQTGIMPDEADTTGRLEGIARQRPQVLSLTQTRGDGPGRRYQGDDTEGPRLRARSVGRIVRDIWSSNSFSAIKHGLAGDGNDVEIVDDAEAGADADAMAPLPADSPPAFAGPASGSGTRFGNAFHGILEEALPGGIRESEEGEELTRRMLSRYGVGAEPGIIQRTWRQALLVMAQPLPPVDGLRLDDLAGSAMVAELEFDLSMGRWDTTALGQLLEDHGGRRYRQTARLLSRLSRPLEGLLHGFIDLTFEWQGQYYVLDYKTNWLGNHLANYGAADMDSAMQAHSYDLQYLIYSVAVHRWLGTLIPDYDYESHFGGAFYLFIRGMHSGGKEGIWFHRPQRAVIEGFDRLMAPESHRRGAA